MGSSTALLYIAIYISTTILASYCQKVSIEGIRFKKMPFIMAFLVHWIFTSFTDIGVDYKNYFEIIEWLGTSSAYYGVEPGFTWICLFFRTLFHSSHIAIFAYKTITIVLFYYCFYRIRNYCSIGLSVFAFNMLLFLQGIYLISMQMSIAVLFLSVIFLYENKQRNAIITLVLSCLLHYSTVLIVPIYCCYFIVGGSNRTISKKSIMLLLVGTILILHMYSTIYSYATSSIVALQGYSAYDLNKDGTVGLGQLIFYLPILYFVIQIYKSNERASVKNMSIVFLIVSFCYALLGYKMDVLMRINMSFFFLYGLFVPAILFGRRYGMIETMSKWRLSIRADYLMWIMYLLVRGYIILAGYMSSDSLSEISVYNFYWPF